MSVLNLAQEYENSDIITIAAPSAVTVGTPVPIPGIGMCVPMVTAASGAVIAFARLGRYTGSIDTGVTVTKGQRLYYITATGKVTNVVTALAPFIGIAADNGTAAAGFVDVLINEANGRMNKTIAASKADTAPTLGVADVLGGVIFGIPTAARTYTLPAATAIADAVPGLVKGDTFEFTIVNNSAGNFSITLAVDATITHIGLAGHLAITQNTVATFGITCTDATVDAETFSVYRM